MKQNRELLFRRVWVVVLQTGFLGFGLLPIGLLGGIAESLGPWWLYGLAVVGSCCISFMLLQASRAAENAVKVCESRYKAVPVPQIARRSKGTVKKGKGYGIHHKAGQGRSAESHRQVV